MQLRIHWVRCGEQWCRFETVNLTGVVTVGVYLIWYRGNPGRMVRVGQGNVAARLLEHRQDNAVLAYRDQGLLVTWAKVEPANLDGVERYFADHYHPLTGERVPGAPAIEVNSPWSS